MVSRGQGDCVARRHLSGPIYARHSAGDTNEPEAIWTQSGSETFRAGPFAVLVVTLARISPGVKKESSSVRHFPGSGGGASMGPLRCPGWCKRGTLRSECVSRDPARQSTTCRRRILLRGGGRCVDGPLGQERVSQYVTASRMLDWAKRDKDPEPGVVRMSRFRISR